MTEPKTEKFNKSIPVSVVKYKVASVFIRGSFCTKRKEDEKKYV